MKTITYSALLLTLGLALTACGKPNEPAHTDEEGHAHDDAKSHSEAEPHNESEGHHEGDRHESAGEANHTDEKGHAHDDAEGHSESDPHNEREDHSEGDRHEQGESGHTEEEGHAEALNLSAEARAAAGLVIAPAGPAMLRETLSLYGVVKPNPERVASVTARFPGMVRSVNVQIGDTVKRGQSLATVESNESLQVYTVSSPQGGVVTERFTNPGEQVQGQPLFTVVDLSTVWVELSLFPRDRSLVKVGQNARVQTADRGSTSEGRIVFVSPLSVSATQSLTARVELENADGRWAPGLYVQAEVAIGEAQLALAVPEVALQELEGRTSVFVEDAGGFESRVVKTGRRDGDVVEILDGLTAGEAVVGDGSFVLKAELGKGEAEHGH